VTLGFVSPAQARSLTSALLDQRPDLGVDRELLAHTVLAIGEHTAKLLIQDPDHFPPDRLVEFAASFLRALRLA
jgi:hypothetical protein